MNELERRLRHETEGESRFDQVSRKVYSVDASIYEVEPAGVFYPRTREDLVAAVKICAELKVPMIARGAATGITGGCIGQGLIIDCSKHLDQVLEIGPDYVRCEPGVVQDDLNDALKPFGKRLGPSTSTGNRATIGGMIANNSAGAHSLRFGQMIDAIEELDLVVSSGEVIHLGPNTDFETPTIRMPKVRSVSGYALGQENSAKLIAGSEGSLGIVAEVKLKIVDLPKTKALTVLSFPDIYAAIEAATPFLTQNPLAVELIDRKIIDAGRLSPSMRGCLDWLEGNPGALLVVESEEGEITDETTMANIWALRKSGLGLLMSRRKHSRAVAFIEDVGVPQTKLIPFLKALTALLEQHGKEAGIYGHVGEGCLHVRPYIDLRKEADQEEMVAIMEEVAALVKQHGGTLSCEHGDGFIRSWMNRDFFGEEVYQAFLDLKKQFDPLGLMNPHKVVNGKTPLENLRKLNEPEMETVFSWEKEGGLPFAAQMCNGNGACRKRDGLMCPSFQAEHDEYHSTRARAQGLRAAMNGEIPFDDPGLYDVLEYCLQCKGCKTECPSQVDMAKMKSEFLHNYHKTHRRPILDWFFGHAHLLAKLSPKRRFSKWAAKQRSEGKRVVLFSDSWTEHLHPHIGKSAWRTLSALGFEVEVPEYQCCGRPLISKGYLLEAKAYAERLVKMLLPFALQGIPIVGLEPSCLFAIRDDHPDLVGTETVATACLTFEEFLISQGVRVDEVVAIHVHCHQRALAGIKDVQTLFPNGQILKVGCCGQAGSFGYEHPKMAKQIAQSQLLPLVEELPKGMPIIANGLSCRGTLGKFNPLHTAQLTDPKRCR